MCGLVGELGSGAPRSGTWLGRAVASLEHRGPDDSGTWVDLEAGIQLGHRRLAILDLSPLGHQPMVSASGRYVLAFNGEIYDHRSLRRDLEGLGARFRGTSDTEVLLQGIERWGLRATLERANGMFALALWDRQDRVLGLARDRLGEKPLFLQQGRGWTRFASELKALRADGAPAPSIDRGALSLYLRFGFVPAPYAIHEGVGKVRPGTIRWLGKTLDREEVYWEVPALGSEPVPDDAEDQLAELLADSVALRMDADVPVGAFLSGGIDSSLIVALMAATGATVHTFTIGFEQAGFDESVHARAVAEHLGTDHTELRITGADAMAVVPRLATMFDEPFADQSAIPTFLVAELARRHVTVALSGDGGDELFGGYTRYRRLQVGAPLAILPAAGARVLARSSARLGAAVPRARGPARTLERVGLGIEAGGTRGLYQSLLSLWERPSEVVGVDEPSTIFTDIEQWPLRRDLVRRAMGADLVSYLPDDILAKVDRTSMAVGLEARVPLLDPRVVAWSRRWARPAVADASQMKAPLRRILATHVPRQLWDRPKMGFGAPVGAWLRGPLRSWAEELLAPEALAADGLIDPVLVRARWAAHLDGSVDQSYPLWAVISFQAWRQKWKL